MEYTRIKKNSPIKVGGTFMFHKVRNVKVLNNYILEVTFEENVIKYYDVKPLFDKWECFKILKENKSLFSVVKVDKGGYGISWNNEIDLSCNELWKNGIKSNIIKQKFTNNE